MIQTIAFLPVDALDIGLSFLACAFMLVNFLFGGFVAIALLFKCIVPMCCAGAPFARKHRIGEARPSYSACFGILLLPLVCFGIGIEIFDLQLSGKLACGAMIVKGLWRLAFSVLFFEAGAFMLAAEMQKLRGNCHG